MKIVLDTNVLFAVFVLEKGFCATIWRACLVQHEIVLSEHILNELRRHLCGKGKIAETKTDEVIDTLRRSAIIVEPALLSADCCRDPDDVPVLGTAIAGNAAVLITGDKDLLTLHPFQSVSIVTPREFHSRYMGT